MKGNTSEAKQETTLGSEILLQIGHCSYGLKVCECLEQLECIPGAYLLE